MIVNGYHSDWAGVADVAGVAFSSLSVVGKPSELAVPHTLVSGGLMVAANIKCPYCALFHTEMAKMNGATQEELSEVYFLASFTARWSAAIRAQQIDFDTFAKRIAADRCVPAEEVITKSSRLRSDSA